MGSNTLALMEDLDRIGGNTSLDLLAGEAIEGIALVSRQTTPRDNEA